MQGLRQGNPALCGFRVCVVKPLVGRPLQCRPNRPTPGLRLLMNPPWAIGSCLALSHIQNPTYFTGPGWGQVTWAAPSPGRRRGFHTQDKKGEFKFLIKNEFISSFCWSPGSSSQESLRIYKYIRKGLPDK